MKNTPIKDPEYIAYIEQLPCFICGHTSVGIRNVYNEYLDKYVKLPCKNTAHHVDTEMTRTKNDHRVIPLCSHYIVSGKNTKDCHNKIHGNKEYKTKECREDFITIADEYYEVYLELKGDK